ncbi:MAG: radical SAM protein [Tannerellaceae bacterium]|jgi:MoaA/NifB/PqqE/SkfB family radical SAM enzyme|nr:radical SAM protein [Tannerellaceae bacterium]
MIKNLVKKLIPYKLILFRRSLAPLLKKITKENMRRKALIPILHIHLTDHCNLNCRGCDNLSPLAPETFEDTAVFERDCARISDLCNGRVEEIQLLGGEPLLHPQVAVFMRIARKYFPRVTIRIVTNGILLTKQKEDFWESCRNNNIQIIVTKYPIKFDHDAAEAFVRKQGVAFDYYGSTGSVSKTMQCSPLDIEGKQDPRESFLMCNSANRCISLSEGKIYTCSLIPYIKYFNSYFKQNLAVTENDYIDIFEAKNIDEIMNFLCKPMPFCRYCNKKGMIWDIGYGVSKKDITEWTGERINPAQTL